MASKSPGCGANGIQGLASMNILPRSAALAAVGWLIDSGGMANTGENGSNMADSCVSTGDGGRRGFSPLSGDLPKVGENGSSMAVSRALTGEEGRGGAGLAWDLPNEGENGS
ncbi:hypothetical protein BCR44DRAFT_1426881 [Catenaria anguillulae PL171]|uniref:Uncharacterized protein n=1 Tax=Catenaria anguillulae PL171 TaxID=765915 RepID=A0A1Y2HYG5_9FUNG|nr:hypothetical protein BCR44DRAFT_1426881 [Catenaria anguillulae PL171]